MVDIEFNYQQKKTVIQAKIDDSFTNVISKFISKTKLDLNNIFFLSNGKNLNKNEKVKSIMSESEKRNKKMIILVYDINNTINIGNTNIIKSKDIICPICQENCLFDLRNYRIKLYGCKNGHKTENIKLKDFNKTQVIDISKIKCDKCKSKNKSETFNNEFYVCYECKMNLCPLCKSVHDKTHSIINYDNKNYVCNKHNETLFKYCEDCKIDMCLSCVNEHKGHNIQSYEDKLVDIKYFKSLLNYLDKFINKFKKNLEEAILKFKSIIENLDIYYNLYNDMLNKYEKNKNRNYNFLFNSREIFLSNEEVAIALNLCNYGYNLNGLLYLYNEMNEENEEIEITYKPNKNEENNKIRIFGKGFVENNFDKCRIIYNENEYYLREYFQDMDEEYNNQDPFTLKLKGINNIKYASYMFKNCESELSIDISKWNTSKVEDMRGMFSECESLSSLPDISKWNTSKVEYMSGMFSECKYLSSLPDISKWNTSKVEYMSDMFSECKSLSSLPDISKWNTSNANSMSQMFNGCESLSSLPDISKWNTSKVGGMSSMFRECKSLSSLPDISKWNTSNANFMSQMFSGCESLSSLPDISKWNTSKFVDMSDMFSGCESLSSLPDISKWNTSNVSNMSDMFRECKSLSSLPDISKWNTSKVENMSDMFSGCESLSSLPDISKWITSNVENMSSMFKGCNSLSSLPDISKWNTSNVENMSYMFNGCKSLSSLPDLSEWNTSKVEDMNDMFSGCKNSLIITSKFKD